MSEAIDAAAKFATPVVTLLGFAGVIITFIYNEGKRSQEREAFMRKTKEEVAEATAGVAKAAADSVDRYNLNKRRYEDIQKELADIKQGGTMFSLRAVAEIKADLSEVNRRLHTFEVTAAQIGVMAESLKWIKEALDEIKESLKDMGK